jgi:hypothetical protein
MKSKYQQSLGVCFQLAVEKAMKPLEEMTAKKSSGAMHQRSTTSMW